MSTNQYSSSARRIQSALFQPRQNAYAMASTTANKAHDMKGGF